MVNRGFLSGPVCPIYGCAVVLMLLLLIPVRDGMDNLPRAVIVMFFSGTMLATMVEYCISWLMEKLFHARWWDYSHMRFSLNGRVNLIISLIWGGLATLFLYLIQPVFENLVGKLYLLGSSVPYIIAGVLIGILTIDLLISSLVALRIGNKLDLLEQWSELIRGYKESLELPTREEILKKIEGIYKRITERGKPKKLFDRKPEANPPTELHILALDVLRRRLHEYANESRIKRESLMAGTRYLQKRMLRAFPHLKRQGNSSSLKDWKRHIDKGKRGDSVQNEKVMEHSAEDH